MKMLQYDSSGVHYSQKFINVSLLFASHDVIFPFNKLILKLLESYYIKKLLANIICMLPFWSIRIDRCNR